MFGTFFNDNPNKKHEKLASPLGGDMNATSKVTFEERSVQSKLSNSVGSDNPLNNKIPGIDLKN
jgi:hypothetical protein